MGKHAGSGGTSAGVAETTFSERARTLLHLGRIGNLSTISRKLQGFPFGSMMPYGLDENGRPVFLISTMAMHTQNLQADPRASLLVTQPDASGDPLGAARITLLGKVLPIPEAEVPEARKFYLARYPNSKNWVDFEDFAFYRMDVMDVYYVGGFGVMGWIAATEYSLGRPDPLADAAADIIGHMNADHEDALKLLARTLTGIESQEAAMTSVDRLGFQVRIKTTEGPRGARIAFSREVGSPAEARNVLIEMVAQARQR
jgi:putative heme iron utilization protein